MVKSIGITLVAAAGFAFAGDFYEGAASAPVSAGTTSFGSSGSGGSNFFIGGGYDYLDDSELDLFSAHIGYDFGKSSIFIEAGIATEDDVVFRGVDFQFIPVTVNYKFEAPIASNLSFYAGGGVGIAFIELEGRGGSINSEALVLQAFTGLVYNFSESFEIYGGLRYLFVDEYNFGGAEIESSDELGFGGGIRINF
jgi:hypothetical protein